MLVTIVVLIILITVVIIYFWLFSEKEENDYPTIHNSGNFSVIRQSPRKNIYQRRGTKEELISRGVSKKKVENYFNTLEKNIDEIEEGDKRGVEFFVFEGEVPNNLQNLYIKRKDIAENSDLVPPYNMEQLVEIKSEFDIKKIIDYDKFIVDEINWKESLK